MLVTHKQNYNYPRYYSELVHNLVVFNAKMRKTFRVDRTRKTRFKILQRVTIAAVNLNTLIIAGRYAASQFVDYTVCWNDCGTSNSSTLSDTQTSNT